MKEIATAYCQIQEQFWQGNGQEIREAILRQAVKSCDLYATDILIFFESEDLKELTESDEGTLLICFRAMGVEWGHLISDCRYVLKLVKDGRDYSLFGEIGNV